ALTLKYKLDNQFELVFVVGFQKILTLTYVDKLIDDVHKEFRDKYRNEFQQKGTLGLLNGTFDFKDDFMRLLRDAEESSKVRAPTVMKTFEQSLKSQKTVKCMIETRGEKPKEKVKNKKNKGSKKEGELLANILEGGGIKIPELCAPASGDREELTKDEILQKNREEFFKRHMKAGEKSSKSPKPEAQKEKGKKPRVWDLGNSNAKVLDYSNSATNGSAEACPVEEFDPDTALGDRNREPGRLYDLEYESDDEAEEEKVIQNPSKPSVKKGGLGGMFGMLKGLVGSKSLTREDMDPVLEKMKDHLIAKNVAAEIAVQLCESVAKKLEGKVMGTFTTVTSTVKQALQVVQILQPRRRVDVLRDVMDAQRHHRPYVVTFCGVNGVGKSTNLAKISFWLIENGFSVLIAACDTFRAGAHGGRTMVQLYEKGYGKDAAGIAMEAISYARNQGFDVVLVDTAGSLVSVPVENRAVRSHRASAAGPVGTIQIRKEEADEYLTSFSTRSPEGVALGLQANGAACPRQVGAAISMTYITSKPIVFVGTGQTYCDLRSLNAKAVVAALMKA
ncbi:Signal recognition particle receptor subunit alpha, partial [Tyto alba]